MNVTSALFAACLVLLCASVTAFSPRRPHRHVSPKPVAEVDRFIPPAAADLFEAIFNPNPRKSRSYSEPDEASQFMGAQFCVALHNFIYHNTVYGAGRDIRNSIRIRDSAVRRYLRENDEELVQQQFVANIDQCGASPLSEERFSCYTNVIVGVLTDINAPTRRPLYINKYIIRYRLEGLSWSLYGESIKLEKCLSIFPQDPTAATPSPPPPPKTTTPADDTTTESTDETTVESSDETTAESTDETTDETTVGNTDETSSETTIAPETPTVETTESEASSNVTSEPKSTTIAPTDSTTAAPEEEKSSSTADIAESSGDEETVEAIETVETVESVENSQNASSE